MRDTLLKVMVLTITLMLPSMAFAQDNIKEQFVTLEEMEIEGGKHVPDLARMTADSRARFQRLSQLKRSFLPKVVQTTQHEAF